MREVCLFKAKEERFLQIADHSQTSGTSRRFVSQNSTTLHVKRDLNYPKLRSLLIVMDHPGKACMVSGLCFTSLQLLRQLDLCGAMFRGGNLPSSIGKLIHLRYLSLKRTNVCNLPSSLRNLKLLVYLNIDVSLGYLFVPNVLMGMQELRYLQLPKHMHRNTKLELSKLVNLETLKCFSTAECSIGDLHGMANLRNLTIIITNETSIKSLSGSIGGLRLLENLIIEDRGSKRMIEEGIILDFIHLKQLRLSISMSRLPDKQHLPYCLTCLDLRECNLEEDPMPILEKLLQLKEVYLLFESFSGRKMVCSDGGFPKMHKLLLSGLKELEEWIVEEGSMPLLHTLEISCCKKLKELPDGLRFITSLKNLTCGFMGREKEGRLSEGGEDYYKVQHIPSVIFLTEPL